MPFLKNIISSDTFSFCVGFALVGMFGWYVLDVAVLAPNDPCRAPHENIEMCNSVQKVKLN